MERGNDPQDGVQLFRESSGTVPGRGADDIHYRYRLGGTRMTRLSDWIPPTSRGQNDESPRRTWHGVEIHRDLYTSPFNCGPTSAGQIDLEWRRHSGESRNPAGYVTGEGVDRRVHAVFPSTWHGRHARAPSDPPDPDVPGGSGLRPLFDQPPQKSPRLL